MCPFSPRVTSPLLVRCVFCRPLPLLLCPPLLLPSLPRLRCLFLARRLLLFRLPVLCLALLLASSSLPPSAPPPSSSSLSSSSSSSSPSSSVPPATSSSPPSSCPPPSAQRPWPSRTFRSQPGPYPRPVYTGPLPPALRDLEHRRVVDGGLLGSRRSGR